MFKVPVYHTHILIEHLNVLILGCYVFMCSVHMMRHCDLKLLNLHLFFYLLSFWFFNYYFNSPNLSNKRQLLVFYFDVGFLEGKVLAKICRSLQACFFRWPLLNSCETGETSPIFTSNLCVHAKQT